ncbi:uncharacterized protein [Cherax quadricarinatus]
MVCCCPRYLASRPLDNTIYIWPLTRPLIIPTEEPVGYDTMILPPRIFIMGFIKFFHLAVKLSNMYMFVHADHPSSHTKKETGNGRMNRRTIFSNHSLPCLPGVATVTMARRTAAGTICLFLIILTCTPVLSLGVMGGEYPVVPWEDMREEVEEMLDNMNQCVREESLCWHNNTKAAAILHDSHELCKPCWCDEACFIYGDCCRDKAQADWGDRLENSGRYICGRMKFSDKRGLLMVNSCLPEYIDRPVHHLCSRQVPEESYSYTLDVPVTSRTTNTTYVNYHCAVCNKDADDLHSWNITIKCNTKQIMKEYSMEEFIRVAQYQPGMRQWRRYKYRYPEDEGNDTPLEVINCYLEVAEFEKPEMFPEMYGGRLCVYPRGKCLTQFRGREKNCKEQVRDCDPAWPNQLDKEKCRRYSQMVQYKDGNLVTVFKNPHCAKCNFINVSSSALSCLPPQKYNKCVSIRRPPISFPLCFSVLMDFREDNCNAADELWDPIHLTCKKIYCGQLYKLENGECVKDLVAYRSVENSTLLDQACPKIMLFENEYIFRDDGSVLVNASQKVYKTGEYEIFSENFLLICNDHYQYTAGFTEVHQLLTLIVLLLSLTGLALHIIIFLLVPRYRNLPGKNLFCLSCCLFVAHLIFLTGMRATFNHEVCVFIAATLHYFWLASFCWMNVMSVDVCRTFTSQLYRGDIDARRTYILYSLYAWSIPALVVTLSLIFDNVNALPDYQPKYATDICWINNRYGLGLFFLLPVGTIVLENTILFFVTSREIYKQAKAARYANTRSQSVKEGHVVHGTNNTTEKIQKQGLPKQMTQNRRSSKERVRLILYVKLGVIQGLSWMTGFVAVFANIPAFWYPFTVFNGLQGAFIFIGFDMKKKVGEALWEALMRKPWKDYRGSKDTRITTAGQSCSSQNRSSRSYSPQQSRSRKTSAYQGPTKDSVQAPYQPSYSERSSSGQVESVRNGDLQASVVKGRFGEMAANDSKPHFGLNCCSTGLQSPSQDVKKQPTEHQKNKPSLQRVMDLLHQLQRSKNSVDLPDLVQQLLLRSGESTDDWQNSSALLKCKSFTEGTNPVVQEEQYTALAARLKLLEYSTECPTIHSLITSHAHKPHQEAQQIQNVVTGPSIVSREGLNPLASVSMTDHYKQPEPLANTVNSSHSAKFCSTTNPFLPQLFTNAELNYNQYKREQAQENVDPPQRRPKSQSFSQISQVALAAAIMRRAVLDAKERQYHGDEGVQTLISDDSKVSHTSLSKKASESLV